MGAWCRCCQGTRGAGCGWLSAITNSSLVDLRDRALLGLGMTGAFRRSELLALRREDVAQDPRGLRIHIPFSKGDQAGEGASVVVWMAVH